MKSVIRVWREVDLAEVEKSLIVIGDLSSECYVCKEIGIETKAVQCPKCGAQFKYMGFRRKVEPNSLYLRGLKEEFPHLTLIDFEDFKKCQNKSEAHRLLGM